MKAKSLVSYAIVVLITLALLELASLFLFESLAGREFSYAALENERLQRIATLCRNLHGDQEAFRGIYDLHPYLGYVGHPGARPWGTEQTAFNGYGMLSVQGYPYPYKKKEGDFVVTSARKAMPSWEEKSLEFWFRKWSGKVAGKCAFRQCMPVQLNPDSFKLLFRSLMVCGSHVESAFCNAPSPPLHKLFRLLVPVAEVGTFQPPLHRLSDLRRVPPI